MRTVALANRAELEQACAASRMPLPPAPAGLSEGSALEPGQVCCRLAVHPSAPDPLATAGQAHVTLGSSAGTFELRTSAGSPGAGHLSGRAARQVADMLHKTVEQLAWAEAEAGRRAPLLAASAQLEAARVEVAWLTAYEADADRYRVRACACVPKPWTPDLLTARHPAMQRPLILGTHAWPQTRCQVSVSQARVGTVAGLAGWVRTGVAPRAQAPPWPDR